MTTKHDDSNRPALPPIVSEEAWQAARDALLVREKEATRALDALAAERRRLPMVEMKNAYALRGAKGTVDLPALFEGRGQLIVYHYMWHGAHRHCSGCASFTDNIGHLAHLHARGTSFALVSTGPLDELLAFRQRMGWTLPWYSAEGTTFAEDCGVGDGGFGLSVFVRDGARVFRTYFTKGRGVDRLRIDFNLLDLTPFGRQETWEESPQGWPQTQPYAWWRLHDAYGAQE